MHRRRFLTAGAEVALAGSVACAGCGSDSAEGISGPVSGGNVKDVPVGHFAFVPGRPVVLARDADGLYAFSSICTHQGCDIASEGSIITATGTATGLRCDCHGSMFDKNGAVIRGPARAPLEHYQVDLAADGNVTIHGGAVVGASVRTKPSA